MKLASSPPIYGPRSSFISPNESSKNCLPDRIFLTFSCFPLRDAGESARNVNAAVGAEILYGALVLERIWMSAGDPNAYPSLIAARPNPLLIVCITTRFGYFGKRVAADTGESG